VGIFFVVWFNLFLFMRGKGGPTDFSGVSVSPQTQRLVTTGPYRFTRNPMVFGTNAVYLSLAIYLNSWGALIAWLLFFVFLVQFAVSREEERLLNDFGQQYSEYRARTSKIIPFLI
jgi:protein-S-isoprenylcysteine O-methyltransferase Ste14